MLDDGSDPGWKPDWRVVLRVLTPAQRRMRRRDRDVLAETRSAFVGYCAMLVVVSVVVVLLGDITSGSHPATVPAVLCTGIGVAGLLARWLLPRKLDPTSPESLASSYRGRFFFQVAVADVPALVAFVIDIQFGPWQVYFIGLAFSAWGLADAAPTAGRLRREQRKLEAAGVRWPLVPALRGSSAGPQVVR